MSPGEGSNTDPGMSEVGGRIVGEGGVGVLPEELPHIADQEVHGGKKPGEGHGSESWSLYQGARISRILM